jgi:hypothetical protein
MVRRCAASTRAAPPFALLAAVLHHDQVAIAQRQIQAKRSEIPMLTPLLDPLELTRIVVTAEALADIGMWRLMRNSPL